MRLLTARDAALIAVLTCGVAGRFQVAADPSPWPMWGHDLQRTGYSPAVGPDKAAVKWQAQIEGSLSSPVMGADGTVYVSSDDAKVYALHKATGAIRWQTSFAGSGVTAPALGPDGTVYVGSGGEVIALDPATGARLFAIHASGGMRAVTPGPDGIIYVTFADGGLMAVTRESADKLFYVGARASLFGSDPYGDLPERAMPAFGRNGLIYIGARVLDRKTGKEAFRLSVPCTSTAAISGSGALYCHSGLPICALDATTGAYRWDYRPWGGGSGGLAIGPDGTLYVAEAGLQAINGGTGIRKWGSLACVAMDRPAIGGDGTVYVADDRFVLYAFDGASGHVKWQFPIPVLRGGRGQSQPDFSPAIGGHGTVYVSSRGCVMAVGEAAE